METRGNRQSGLALRRKVIQIPVNVDVGNDATDVQRPLIAARHVPIYIEKVQAIGIQDADGFTNEVQTITMDATGGTWKAAFGAAETAALAFNVSTADLQTALRALSTIDGAHVTVTGTAGSEYVVTFGGKFEGVNVAEMVVTDIDLTGGGSEVTIATTTQGASGAGKIQLGVSDNIGGAIDADAILDFTLPQSFKKGQVIIASGMDFIAARRKVTGYYPGTLPAILNPGEVLWFTSVKQTISGRNDGIVVANVYYWEDDQLTHHRP